MVTSNLHLLGYGYFELDSPKCLDNRPLAFISCFLKMFDLSFKMLLQFWTWIKGISLVTCSKNNLTKRAVKVTNGAFKVISVTVRTHVSGLSCKWDYFNQSNLFFFSSEGSVGPLFQPADKHKKQEGGGVMPLCSKLPEKALVTLCYLFIKKTVAFLKPWYSRLTSISF